MACNSVSSSAISAAMGYVGTVALRRDTDQVKTILRAKSVDVKASQSITNPEIVDGRIDNTVYQIGPIEIGGGISFPLIHEGSALGSDTATICGTTNSVTNMAQFLWEAATAREGCGNMLDSFDIYVRYSCSNDAISPSPADRLFKCCYVNSYKFSVRAKESVDVSIDILGVDTSARPGSALSGELEDMRTYANEPDFLSPARIVTWNDFAVRLFLNGATSSTVDVLSAQIVEFNCNVENNLDRYYTFNGSLAPQAIGAKKRKVSGDLKLMGINNTLSQWAYENQQRFTSDSAITFGYKLGTNTTAYFAVAILGVMFEIEEVSLSNDLIQSNVKWMGHAKCGTWKYQAISAGGSGANVGSAGIGFGTDMPYPTTAGGVYGDVSSPLFPGF